MSNVKNAPLFYFVGIVQACEDDDDGDDCYVALDKERVRGKSGPNGEKTYQLELQVAELSEEDVSEPMVLVKEYKRSSSSRRNRNNGKRYKIYYVPNGPNGLRAGGGSPEELESGEEACVVNGQKIDVDDR